MNPKGIIQKRFVRSFATAIVIAIGFCVDREKVSLLSLDHEIRLMIKAGLPNKVIIGRLQQGIQTANKSAVLWEKNVRQKEKGR